MCVAEVLRDKGREGWLGEGETKEESLGGSRELVTEVA